MSCFVDLPYSCLRCDQGESSRERWSSVGRVSSLGTQGQLVKRTAISALCCCFFLSGVHLCLRIHFAIFLALLLARRVRFSSAFRKQHCRRSTVISLARETRRTRRRAADRKEALIHPRAGRNVRELQILFQVLYREAFSFDS